MEQFEIKKGTRLKAANARILFVIPSLGAGGSERVVTTLANHWAGEGRPIAIANFDPPEEPPFYALASQVDLFPLDHPPSKEGLLDQFRQTGHRVAKLQAVIDVFKPDVIISFLTKANIMALLATHQSGIPVIISERNNPTLQTFNAFWRMARSRSYPNAFSFVTMTKGAAEYYPEKQRPRTRIIPNPVNLPANWQNKRKGNTITAVGRLADQKQFHLLIDAFAKIAGEFPDWNLTIWGEGGLRDALEKQRKALNLDDRVSLPGLTDIPGQWIETADVVAMSSAYEGWPNVVVEAMAAQLPVVTFDCEHGPSDMIEDGVTGYLVPQDDVQGLGDALAKVLRDPDYRQSLADNSLKASARYDTSVIADQWMEIVEAAVASE